MGQNNLKTMFSIGLIAVLICLAGITADPKPNPEPEPKPNPKDIHIHLHGLKGVAGSGGMDGKMAEESGGIGDESAAIWRIWRIWQKIWRVALSSKPTILSWRTQRSLFYHQLPQTQRQRTTWNFASPRTKSMVGLRNLALHRPGI